MFSGAVFSGEALALVIGYFLGSIPFGLLITRLAGARDPRTIGSGNIGATNVLRTGRKDLAAATLALDMLKGTLAVYLGLVWFGQNAGVAAGAGAFFGHLYPVWLRFAGGKGVATFLGALIGLNWPSGLVFALVWLSVAAATRYSSAAALVASAISPLALLYFEGAAPAFVFALLAALLWLRHSVNIARLLKGAEGKIGQKG